MNDRATIFAHRPCLRGCGFLFALLCCLFLRAAPGWSETASEFLDKARGHYSSGDYSSALIEAKNALRASPDSRPARLLLVRALLELGQAGAAEVELKRLSQTAGDEAAIALLIARTYLQQQKHDEVLSSLKVDQLPADMRAAGHILRGQALLETERYAAARGAFSLARDLDEGNDAALLGLARVAISELVPERARELAEKVVARSPKNAEGWFLIAEARRWAGEWAAAEQGYDKALDLDATHFAARLNRAAMRINLGKQDTALPDVLALAERAPNNIQVAYMKAVLLAQRGDVDGSRAALDHASAALSKLPDEALETLPQALLMGGAIETARGNWERAARYLSGYLRRHGGDTAAQLMLADAYLRTGQVSRSLATLQDVAPMVGDDPRFLVLRGRAFMRNNEPGRAKLDFERALSLEPEASQVRTYLGISRLKIGGLDAAQAITDLQSAMETTPENPSPGIILGLVHLQNGRFQEAYALAQDLARQHPRDPNVFNIAGSALLARGAFGAAEVAYSKAIEHDPRFLPAHYNLVTVALARDDRVKARDRLAVILRYDPDQGRAAQMLAQLAEVDGDIETARRMLENLRRKSPDDRDAVMELVRFELRHKRHDQAIQIAREFATHTHRSSPALEMLGRVLIAGGDQAEARGVFAELADAVSDSADELFVAARLQRLAGDQEGARRSEKRVLELDPTHEPTHSAAVAALLKAGDAQAAGHAAEALVIKYPEAATGHLLRGDVRMYEKRYAEAEWAYSRALTIRQDWPVLRRLFQAKRAQGKQTTRLLDLWCKDRPERRDCFMLLASAYLDAGDLDQALNHYQRLLSHRPNDPILLNNLAGTLQRLNDPRALSIARRALGLAPGNPIVLDTLGWIEVQRGMLKEGIAHLRGAFSHLGHLTEVRYHLGAALLKAGQREEAEELLRAVIEEAADSEYGKAAIAALDG